MRTEGGQGDAAAFTMWADQDADGLRRARGYARPLPAAPPASRAVQSRCDAHTS